MPQQWKYTIIMVLYKIKDRPECANCGGTSLVAHADEILLKIIARRPSEYCKRVGILPGEQGGFRPNRFTTDRMFVIRRLHELARKKRIPLYVCFIDLTKAYGSIDRILLWTVLTCFGVPQGMISAIRQFHDGMRACARLVNRVCARSGSLWNKAFVKGACSRRVSRRTKTSWTLWCTRERKRGRGRQLPERQSWRHRFGACLTLTMPGSSRNHPNS